MWLVTRVNSGEIKICEVSRWRLALPPTIWLASSIIHRKLPWLPRRARVRPFHAHNRPWAPSSPHVVRWVRGCFLVRDTTRYKSEGTSFILFPVWNRQTRHRREAQQQLQVERRHGRARIELFPRLFPWQTNNLRHYLSRLCMHVACATVWMRPWVWVFLFSAAKKGEAKRMR